MRSSSSCFVITGTFISIPGKLTPFLSSIFPSDKDTQSRVSEDNRFFTSRETLPSSISIFAPEVTFSNFTPFETCTILEPFLILLMIMESPFFRIIFSRKFLTLIFGPARSARIVGRKPSRQSRDLIKSKDFSFSSIVPCDKLILKQETPRSTRF